MNDCTLAMWTSGSGPHAICSATWSSVTISARDSKLDGSGSSWLLSPGRAAVGHHSRAIRRASASSFAQHTVAWPILGRGRDEAVTDPSRELRGGGPGGGDQDRRQLLGQRVDPRPDHVVEVAPMIDELA